MTNVETILVVFLSVALLVFLILGIVLITIFIGILRNVRRISQRAEEASTSFADIAQMVSNKVAPVALSAAIAAALRRFKSK